MANNPKYRIFTDGACSGNPGPGGYGVILKSNGEQKEMSAGYRKTTNNRMELMAVLAGLQDLVDTSTVTLYTDSRYIVDAVNQGWAKRWRAKGWKRNKRDYAENADLWEQILPLLEKHTVQFEWVKGHAGHPENERCDKLAVLASRSPTEVDSAFEDGKTTKTQPRLF